MGLCRIFCKKSAPQFKYTEILLTSPSVMGLFMLFFFFLCSLETASSFTEISFSFSDAAFCTSCRQYTFRCVFYKIIILLFFTQFKTSVQNSLFLCISFSMEEPVLVWTSMMCYTTMQQSWRWHAQTVKLQPNDTYTFFFAVLFVILWSTA